MWRIHRLQDHFRNYQSKPGTCLGALSRHFGAFLKMCNKSGGEPPTSGGPEHQRQGPSWPCCTKLKNLAGLGDEEGKSCGGKCSGWKAVLTKAFLVLVNLCFLIAGWVMVVLAIWLHVHQDAYIYTYLLRDNPTNPIVVFERIPLLLITVGFLLAGMSFLGCCGACADSVCFLSFYAILLIGVILAEMVLGVIFLSSKEEISRQLARSMRYQVRHEYNKTSQLANTTSPDIYRITLAWDTLQTQSNCCGAAGPLDYRHSSWYNNTNDAGGTWVPQSCCRLSRHDPDKLVRPVIMGVNYCQVEALIYPKHSNDTYIYLKTQGCQTVVHNWLYEYEDRISLLMAFLILIQVISLVLGCVLMTWVRKKATDYWFCEEEEYDQ